jgi:hypothetical protein
VMILARLGDLRTRLDFLRWSSAAPAVSLGPALWLGSWPAGDTTGIPVILCDEWSAAQVKAFRLMVNRSVSWANWDEELLALELHDIQELDFDLSLTGFEPGEIDDLLGLKTTRKRTPLRRCPTRPCPGWATYGSWASTGYFAATQRLQKLSRDYSGSAGRD